MKREFEQRVVVTGGSGLLGRALRRFEPEWTYLSSKDYDLTSQKEVKCLFRDLEPTGVIHLAGRVGGIKANLAYPAEFFYENAFMNTAVIHEAHRARVSKLLVCLSTCAFPDTVEEYPMREEDLHSGPPAVSNLPYGYAKRMAEVQIGAYREQYDANFISVCPSNVYGPEDNFDPDSSHLIPSLLRKLLLGSRTNSPDVELWGTGDPLRQQLYVDDLAKIMIGLFQTYSGAKSVLIANPQNLSIRQIATTVAGVIGYRGHLLFNGRMDGQFRKDVSTGFLKSLMPDCSFTSLEDGVAATLKWYLATEHGVRDRD